MRRGDEITTLHPSRSYFPSNLERLGAVSRYFEGEATSEVGLREGLRRDVWTAVSPDLTNLEPIISRGDKVFEQASALPEAERAAALGRGASATRGAVPRRGRPGTFRVLISPLVTWIWLGALIVFTGGFIALWPVPARAAAGAELGTASGLARGGPAASEKSGRGSTCETD